MYEIALIQKMVKQNQKDILKITNKVCKKKSMKMLQESF